MKNPVFTGAGVAIITPMYEDGSINFDELGRIVEDQIARGTDAIVICGTTGECSTMTDEEQLAAIKYTVDLVNHRVPVIAGAGSNDTDHGCALAAKSAACGADALLLVTPYYNKTSQAGLVAHFTAMAEAGGIPVILYNVPSRTGLNIAPETAKELSKHPLINGIKEASGNIGQVAKIAALCGDELNIYSGNDDQVVPLLSLGGKGVISVVSNVKPELVHNCCKAWFDGDTAKARALQLEMLPLCDALFCEVNPIPVKYAMNVLGWEAGECRLPLVEPSDAHKEQIEQALQAAGIAATLRFWETMPEDVITTGLWKGEADYGRIPIQTVDGVKIAYLSYTEHTNGIPRNSKMTANIIYTSQQDVMEQQVRAARQEADFVVVGVHWGVEDSHNITQAQRTLAQSLADWGADVIIGTHPHVLQDAEWRTAADGRNVFVAYSLGNFLSTQSKPDQLIGAVLTLDLEQTTEPDGSVRCAVRGPKLHVTVTHYDAGKSNVRTYLFRDYTPELAKAHGVRAAYPNFGYDYIRQTAQTYINSEFLELA